MTLATAPAVRTPVLAGAWLLYQHADPREPLPLCHLCPYPIAHQSRAIALVDQELAPNHGPPLAHQGCAFVLRRRLRLHVL